MLMPTRQYLYSISLFVIQCIFCNIQCIFLQILPLSGAMKMFIGFFLIPYVLHMYNIY